MYFSCTDTFVIIYIVIKLAGGPIEGFTCMLLKTRLYRRLAWIPYDEKHIFILKNIHAYFSAVATISAGKCCIKLFQCRVVWWLTGFSGSFALMHGAVTPKSRYQSWEE